MRLTVMALLDKKARVYALPFFVPNTEIGKDYFADALQSNNRDLALCRHPEDFSLWEFGTFDDEVGKFDLHPAPLHVAEAINVTRRT